MKLKYFLRGLGIGIIFTAIILLLANTSSKNRITMTDEQVIAKAKKLGMVHSKDMETQLDKTLDDLQRETKEPIKTNNPDNQKDVNVTSKPKETKEPVKTNKPTSMPTERPKETDKPKKVTLVVSSGMFSEQVSKEVQNLGLVKNAKELNLFLYNNGYSNRIRIGTFQIPLGATYAEIAEIITK